MAEEKVIIKGGGRPTLALIIAIIALIFALIAFYRTSEQPDLQERIKNLNTKIQTMKKESSDQMGKILKETKKSLQNLKIEVGRKGQKTEPAKPEAPKQPAAQEPTPKTTGSSSGG